MPVRCCPTSSPKSLPIKARYTAVACYLRAMNEIALRDQIVAAWSDRSLLQQDSVRDAVAEVMRALDKGALRVAQPESDGSWKVNEWVKQAVLLNFPIQTMETVEVGPFEFHDKMPLKRGYAEAGVRVVPHAVVRYGAYVAPDCILMPSYVNLGAYVGERTMVDTWATVGSCAQIGADVHLSGGVGIGGVLEPLQASPVVIEDGAFVGSRCIVVEGVRVGKEAVLGANVVLTASTPIVDVRGPGACGNEGRGAASGGGHSGVSAQIVPRGHLQRALRVDHWGAERKHRQEDFPQRRPPSARRGGVTSRHGAIRLVHPNSLSR